MALPLLAQLGITFLGPQVLAKIFQGSDPGSQLRKELERILSPSTIARLAHDYEGQIVNSPGYAQAEGQIATGANSLQNRTAANLASRGLDTTGIAAIANAGAGSAGQFQLGQLRGNASTAAFQMASDNQNRLASLLAGTGAPRNLAMEGAGLSFRAILPLLLGTKDGVGGDLLANMPNTDLLQSFGADLLGYGRIN